MLTMIEKFLKSFCTLPGWYPIIIGFFIGFTATLAFAEARILKVESYYHKERFGLHVYFDGSNGRERFKFFVGDKKSEMRTTYSPGDMCFNLPVEIDGEDDLCFKTGTINPFEYGSDMRVIRNASSDQEFRNFKKYMANVCDILGNKYSQVLDASQYDSDIHTERYLFQHRDRWQQLGQSCNEILAFEKFRICGLSLARGGWQGKNPFNDESYKLIQRGLKEAGFYDKAIDGDFGKGSCSALASYMQANNYTDNRFTRNLYDEIAVWATPIEKVEYDSYSLSPYDGRAGNKGDWLGAWVSFEKIYLDGKKIKITMNPEISMAFEISGTYNEEIVGNVGFMQNRTFSKLPSTVADRDNRIWLNNYRSTREIINLYRVLSKEDKAIMKGICGLIADKGFSENIIAELGNLDPNKFNNVVDEQYSLHWKNDINGAGANALRQIGNKCNAAIKNIGEDFLALAKLDNVKNSISSTSTADTSSNSLPYNLYKQVAEDWYSIPLDDRKAIQNYLSNSGSVTIRNNGIFSNETIMAIHSYGESNSIKEPLNIFAALLTESKGSSCKVPDTSTLKSDIDFLTDCVAENQIYAEQVGTGKELLRQITNLDDVSKLCTPELSTLNESLSDFLGKVGNSTMLSDFCEKSVAPENVSDALKPVIEGLKLQIAELGKIRIGPDEISNIRTQIQNMEIEQIQLESQLEQVNKDLISGSELQELENKAKNLSSLIEEKSFSIKDKEDQLAMLAPYSNDSQVEIINDLQSDIVELKSDQDKLNTQIAEIEKSIREEGLEEAKLREEISQIQGKIESTKAIINATSKMSEDLGQEASKLAKIVNELEFEISDIKSRLATNSEEKEFLQNELAKKKKRNDEISYVVTTLEGSIDNLIMIEADLEPKVRANEQIVESLKESIDKDYIPKDAFLAGQELLNTLTSEVTLIQEEKLEIQSFLDEIQEEESRLFALCEKDRKCKKAMADRMGLD